MWKLKLTDFKQTAQILMSYVTVRFEFIKSSSVFPAADWTKRHRLIFEISILRFLVIKKVSGPHSNPEKFGSIRKLWFNDLRNHIWSQSHSLLPNFSCTVFIATWSWGRCHEGTGNGLKNGLEVLLQDTSRKCVWGDVCPKAKINCELIFWITPYH